ncbi:MAG: hypothetical protein J6Y04_05980 [Bacteroidaceae bacterium]|nr:hypothetical protein [Bacteroidaceae bacterium]
MNTRYLIYIMMLATMSIASCTQNVTEKPDHEVETLTELFDSLANRGAPASHVISCAQDSTMSDEYTIFTVVEDTTKMTDVVDKEWYRQAADNQRFLLRNATYLVEKMCKTAKESYRYTTPDSVDYSITIEKEPRKMLTFRHYKGERNADCIVLFYTIKKTTKVTPKSADPKPMQALLKQLLAEQKGVKQYPVHYEWDEGVPFPTEGEIYTSFTFRMGHGADSLAASLVTGTHYIIPVKGFEQAQELENELCNRMIRFSAEQPVFSRLQTAALPGCEKRRLQHYWQYATIKGKRRMIYQLEAEAFGNNVEGCGNALHILELNTDEAPRLTIPLNWWAIMRTHNTNIYYREEYEKHLPNQ